MQFVLTHSTMSDDEHSQWKRFSQAQWHIFYNGGFWVQNETQGARKETMPSLTIGNIQDTQTHATALFNTTHHRMPAWKETNQKPPVSKEATTWPKYHLPQLNIHTRRENALRLVHNAYKTSHWRLKWTGANENTTREYLRVGSGGTGTRKNNSLCWIFYHECLDAVSKHHLWLDYFERIPLQFINFQIWTASNGEVLITSSPMHTWYTEIR